MFVNKPNKLYQMGHPEVNKYHTWLRLGLSPLRDHLLTHHIVDNNICTFCSNEPETTAHYLCTCSTFATQRDNLLLSLAETLGNEVYSYTNTQLTNLLVYGNAHLSYQENKEVFVAVHSFIGKTKRFIFVTNYS